MKRILFFILLISSFIAKGQTEGQTDDSTKYVYYRYQYGTKWIRGTFDSVLKIPLLDTIVKPDRAGGLTMRPQDKIIYYWDGTSWFPFNAGGSGANNYPTAISFSNNTLTLTRNGLGSISAAWDSTLYHSIGFYDARYMGSFDTTTIYNNLALKLNKSDTAAMLSPYLRKIDTANVITNQYSSAENKSFYVQNNGRVDGFLGINAPQYTTEKFRVAGNSRMEGFVDIVNGNLTVMNPAAYDGGKVYVEDDQGKIGVFGMTLGGMVAGTQSQNSFDLIAGNQTVIHMVNGDKSPFFPGIFSTTPQVTFNGQVKTLGIDEIGRVGHYNFWPLYKDSINSNPPAFELDNMMYAKYDPSDSTKLDTLGVYHVLLSPSGSGIIDTSDYNRFDSAYQVIKAGGGGGGSGTTTNALSIAAELHSGGATTFNGSSAVSIGIQSGSVTNAMLAGSIAYSKLSLTGAILNADLAGSIDAAKINTGVVSNTEFNYLDGVTSAIQTQLNAKQGTLTLTTTGTSGAATLVGNTLNIPQYSGGGFTLSGRATDFSNKAVLLYDTVATTYSYADILLAKLNNLQNNDFVIDSSGYWVNRTPTAIKTVLSLNNVENTALSTWVGSYNITTLGTISTGTWHGTAIADSYISSASTWNAKQNALSGTGFVKISGTTISYDNSTYLTTSSASSTYQTLANLSTSTTLGTSNTLYPSQNAVKTYVDNAVSAAGGYTDEMAQDAVGAMVSSEFTYTDATPLLSINSIASSKITGTKTSSFISDFTTAVQTVGDARYLQSYTETDPKRVTTAAFSGTTTKTLTLTLADASTVTASFTDSVGAGGGGGVSFGTSGQIPYMNTGGTDFLYSSGFTFDGTVLTSTTFQAGNGTVTSPSISFTNYTNAGFYMPIANQIGFVVSGSDKMRISGTALYPTSNNNISNGTGANSWKGIYIASANAINWGNGNVTLTHATGQLTLAGGNLIISNLATGGTAPTTTGTTKMVVTDANGLLSFADIPAGGGSMVYPSAGIAVSTGSAWGTSITDNSTNWNTAYTDRMKWDGGSTGLTASTGRTSLGATTVGSNLFTLTNPSAITFLRVNADNTVSALDAATFRTAIGAGTSSTNGTVTAFSAGDLTPLFTTSTATNTTTPALGFTLSNAAAHTFFGNNTGSSAAPTYFTLSASDIPDLSSTYQPLDADLTSIAGQAGTSGYLKKTAANTWTLDNSTFLTANQTITLSGDISGSGSTAITTTIGSGKVTNAMLAGSIALSKLSITGTPDGTKFLRDDGTWQTVGGSGTISSGTTNNIPKYTGSTTLGASVIWESSGHVGINQGTPLSSSSLTIKGQGTASTTTYSFYTTDAAGTFTSSLDDKGNLAIAGVLQGAVFAIGSPSGDYTIPSGNYFFKLLDLTALAANKTVTFPDPTSYSGQEIRIINNNSNGTYHWLVSGTVQDASGSNITQLTNGTSYTFISNGTVWIKAN